MGLILLNGRIGRPTQLGQDTGLCSGRSNFYCNETVVNNNEFLSCWCILDSYTVLINGIWKAMVDNSTDASIKLVIDSYAVLRNEG